MPENCTASDQGLSIGVENDVVVARWGQEKIGQVEVPQIRFQWCRDAIVPMGGIAGVGTNERFRRRGIAQRMMQQAVAHSAARGEVCSGVSTSETNVARRLYARAGHVYLFRMQGYARPPRPSEDNDPQIQIRGYAPGDEHEMVDLRLQALGASFGCQEQSASGWLNRRRAELESDPERALVAVEDGRPVGYASCFGHWFGPACDLYVGACRDRLRTGRALLRAMEGHLAAVGIDKASFSATEDEAFLRRLLKGEGYRAEYPHVYQLSILDVGGLLDQMRDALQARLAASGLAEWTGAIRVETESQQGALALGADPERAQVTLQAPQRTITRVLAGRLPAWEAYLQDELRLDASPDTDASALLQTLFPNIMCCHPIDEWW